MTINNELIDFINSCKRDSINNRISLYLSDHDYKLNYMYPFSYDKWDDGVYVTKSLFRNPSMDIPEFRINRIYLFVYYKYSVERVTTYFIDLDDFKNNKWYTTASTEYELNKLAHRFIGINPSDIISDESINRISELNEFIKNNKCNFVSLDEMIINEENIMNSIQLINKKEK